MEPQSAAFPLADTETFLKRRGRCFQRTRPDFLTTFPACESLNCTDTQLVVQPLQRTQTFNAQLSSTRQTYDGVRTALSSVSW
ncbi:unnamed protein product [Pleuronectes platessa]|uniref:Uncharacterized protein n=1 Tax=Pleuronectes platessa TaxID=8262 RepID=A0A9N7VPK0_PLEPL|nr:unnamed protein product [Pleuronectes platessa]